MLNFNNLINQTKDTQDVFTSAHSVEHLTIPLS